MTADGSTRLKYLLARQDSGLWGDDPLEDCAFEVLRSTEVALDGSWHVESPAVRCLSASDRAVGPLAEGDVLITMSSGSAAHVGKAALVTSDVARRRAYFSNFTQRLRPNESLESRYLSYLFRSQHSRDALRRASSQSMAIRNLKGETLAELRVPVTDVVHQVAIADFLDREVGRLDAVAAAKRRMIELLAEKRTALITHTVTKGLNPNAPMKETGIPWLGDIPAHWDVALLNKVAATGSGHTPSRSRPDWWVDCTIPWITTGEVDALRSDGVHVLVETRERISELGLTNSSAKLHPPGTVFLSRTASPGFAGVMGTDMATSQDFVTWTPGNGLDSRYLAVVLRAMRSDLLGRLTQGSTHRTIYMPDLMGLAIPYPPLEEQRAIAETVNGQLSTLNSATDALQRQLDLLSEFKTALITAAVTGQLDEATLKGEKSLDDAMGELRENNAA